MRDASLFRGSPRDSRRQGQRTRGRSFWFFGDQKTLAERGSHVLEQPTALRRGVLLNVQGVLRFRGRRAARPRRVLLDHGQGGRRYQRERPPDGNRGGGVRACFAPVGVRSRRRRDAPRHKRRRYLLLRRVEGWRTGERRVDQGAEKRGAHRNRPHRHARRYSVLGRVAENAVGENHAAHFAETRGKPSNRPCRFWRHLNPGGPVHRRAAQGERDEASRGEVRRVFLTR
mmetsp:Transcript_11452/g.42430  ORF Transcript_11452/g.42430 Transcript_11452/m.42430 type:complete len:229 (-) Transcript_11452:4-690(-)